MSNAVSMSWIEKITNGGKLSLNVKLTFLVSIMLMAMLGTIAASLWVIKAQKADGKVINLAGRQRMLTQKYAKEIMSELYNNQPIGSLSKNTEKLFDVTLQALTDGGQTYTDIEMQHRVSIPATEDATIKAQLAEVQKLWNKLKLAANQLQTNRDNKVYLSQVLDLSNQCLKAMHKAVGMYQQKSDSRIGTLMTIQYSAGIISLIAFSIIIFYIRSKIVSPIREASKVANAVAAGRLDYQCDVKSNDEVGDLAKALNTMCGNLTDLVWKIKENTDVIKSGATEFSSTANQLANIANDTTSRSSTVAAAAEEMSVNLSNMATSTEQMADNVKSVAAAVEQMTASINEVSKSTEHAASITEEATVLASSSNQKISQLGAAADEIGKVIEVIQDIAEQTNLLALNATIEAARAGEAGKGFAVVANEVKELAKQTAEATEDIANRIQAIQSSSNEAVQAINEISDVINKVNNTTRAISTSVEEQSSAVNEIAQNVSQVASASDVVSSNVSESAVAGQEITKNIANVDQSAKQISETAEHTKQAAEKLADVAEELHSVITKFQI